MNRKSAPHSSGTAALAMYRTLKLILFCVYVSIITFWFSCVVDVTSPSLILLCFFLALGSLKVSVNWTVLGVFVVFIAKYDWQAPRIDLALSLWLSYLGLIVCGCRAYYSAIQSRLRLVTSGARTDNESWRNKWIFQLSLRVCCGLLGGLLVLVAGVVLLMYSPYGEHREVWLDSSLVRKEVMWPGASALVFLLAGYIVLREWSWRQKNARQVAVFLRSDRLKWECRDLIRVVKIQSRDNSKK